jgi:hypothetical protein
LSLEIFIFNKIPNSGYSSSSDIGLISIRQYLLSVDK